MLLGRPYLWGLAVDGEAGVAAVIDNVIGELDLAMGLAGVSDVAALGLETLGMSGHVSPGPV